MPLVSVGWGGPTYHFRGGYSFHGGGGLQSGPCTINGVSGSVSGLGGLFPSEVDRQLCPYLDALTTLVHSLVSLEIRLL